MTISLTHTFVSGVADDPSATTDVRPSNWNAQHTFSMAGGNLLGRGTAGAGAPEEIAITNDTNVTATLTASLLTLGWSGTLAATRGGTGAGTFTLNGVLYGNGTGALQATAQGGASTILSANAGAPTWATLASDTNVTIALTAGVLTMGWAGTLAVGRGGTGAATFTANGVLYGNTTGAVLVTAQGAANTILTANAGAPVFSAAPVIGTSVTCPTIIGGSAVGSSLTLDSTSAIGTSDFINFTTANNNERMRIDTTGSINIGNAGVIQPDFFGTPVFQVSGLSNRSQWSADAVGARMSFTKSRSATVGGKTALTLSDAIAYLSFDGMDATATPVLREAAAIQAVVDVAPTAGSVGGRLVFSTAPSGTGTATERVRIDNTGYVTIGGYANTSMFGFAGTVQSVVSNPAAALAYTGIALGANNSGCNIGLAKTRGTAPTINTIVAVGDNLGVVAFAGNDGTGYKGGAQISATVESAPAANSMPSYLSLSTTPSGASTSTERMRITSAGITQLWTTPSQGLSSFDTSVQTGISIANGANAIILSPTFNGIVFIANSSQNQIAMFWVGPSVVQAAIWQPTGTFWQVTATPTAGANGLNWDGTNYRIYNNQGNTNTYKIFAFRVY